MMRSQFGRVIASVAAVALLMTAAAYTAAAEASPDSARTSGDERAAAGEPVVGGTLEYLLQNEPVGLDPLRMTANSRDNTGMIAFAIFDALMLQDSKTGEIVPRIAESFVPDEVGATWTLVLRAGVLFSDGTPYDAEAVKFNFERHADPDNASIALEPAGEIASMSVVDETTLEIELATPNLYFDQAVGTQMYAVGSPTAIEESGDDFTLAPVGAGPFVLDEWRSGDRAILSRNPSYWDAPRPYVDELVLRWVSDVNQRANTLAAGEADMMHVLEGAVADRLTEQGFESGQVVLNGGRASILNTHRPPFNDRRVREAYALALDREALIETVLEGSGLAATTIFTETSPFYQDVPFPAHNPARAQELFNEVAADTGEPVRIHEVGYPSQRGVTEYLQAQMSAYDNVEYTFEIVDVGPLLQRMGELDFDVVQWAPADVAVEPRFYQEFHSQSARNKGQWANPIVDAALEAARVTTDIDERIEQYRIMQEQITEELPVVFTVRNQQITVFRAEVKGIEFFGDGVPLLERVWIDE